MLTLPHPSVANMPGRHLLVLLDLRRDIQAAVEWYMADFAEMDSFIFLSFEKGGWFQGTLLSDGRYVGRRVY